MNIKVEFEWTVEEVAYLARLMFGHAEYEWVNNWTDADIEDFASRMKSVLNYQVTEKFKEMARRYVQEEFVSDEEDVNE